MTTTTYTYMDSPIGGLLVASRDDALTAIRFQNSPTPQPPEPGWQRVDALGIDAVAQLQAYFDGRRRDFDLPLAPVGTPFQQAVWQALQAVPYGETWSYSDLARHIGKERAVRAVGAANGRNPLPIVIPCHRVVGRNGTLTGYAGGLSIKRTLLALEHHHAPHPGLQTTLFK